MAKTGRKPVVMHEVDSMIEDVTNKLKYTEETIQVMKVDKESYTKQLDFLNRVKAAMNEYRNGEN